MSIEGPWVEGVPPPPSPNPRPRLIPLCPAQAVEARSKSARMIMPRLITGPLLVQCFQGPENQPLCPGQIPGLDGQGYLMPEVRLLVVAAQGFQLDFFVNVYLAHGPNLHKPNMKPVKKPISSPVAISFIARQSISRPHRQLHLDVVGVQVRGLSKPFSLDDSLAS